MRLIFFDTEHANCFKGIIKICSLGYVLTDEKLKIIKCSDILIKPEDAFDKRVLDQVIAYSERDFKKAKNFKENYQEIKNLFTDVIAIGHTIKSSDVRALDDACKRYDLERIIYPFYDIVQIYKDFKGIYDKHSISLAKIAADLGVGTQDDRHTSMQDASLTYSIFKRICNLSNLDAKSLLDKYRQYCYEPYIDKNGNYQYYHEADKAVLYYRTSDDNRMIANKKVIYKTLIESKLDFKTITNNLNGLVYAIDDSYEKNNFKESVYLFYLIRVNGGYYTNNLSSADYFIKCSNEVSRREAAIENIKLAGGRVQKISLDDFKKLISYNEEKLDDTFQLVLKKLDVKISR